MVPSKYVTVTTNITTTWTLKWNENNETNYFELRQF